MSAAEAAVASATDGKIVCHIDNARVHFIQAHIKNNHPDWTIERYQADFPGAPLMSEHGKALYEKKLADDQAKAKAAAAATPAMPVTTAAASAPAVHAGLVSTAFIERKQPMHEVFDLGSTPIPPAALNAKGEPINTTVYAGHDAESLNYVPSVDDRYVFNIDLLKKVITGLELNKPILLWGFHGTGKTSVIQQACARTRRPFIRKQHTINMQESDVLGQWTVKDGSTIYQLGPLAMAMIHGWVYCADEYDFAMPSVLAVYQPVMEGEPLMIADAPPEFRKITPHKDFRFVATGNTNGTGDETGLYQGTLIQNSANYSRFGITVEVEYMEAKIEEAILMSRTRIQKVDAAKIVKLAKHVRDMFRDGKISTTISPRELITCAQLGLAYGGAWKLGMELAFANRLSRVDKKVLQEYMQRAFDA